MGQAQAKSGGKLDENSQELTREMATHQNLHYSHSSFNASEEDGSACSQVVMYLSPFFFTAQFLI
jgi:hypothetical protein